MKKEHNDILIFSFVYFIIFMILPFYLFIFSGFVKDIAWYGNYFLFIFPLSFIIFLIVYKSKFKGTLKFYKKLLLFYWIVFLGLCTFLGFFTYYIINIAFQNFGF